MGIDEALRNRGDVPGRRAAPLAKFSAAVVASDAFRRSHAARQKAFSRKTHPVLTWLSTGHSEAVTQRLELAALHARSGGTSRGGARRSRTRCRSKPRLTTRASRSTACPTTSRRWSAVAASERALRPFDGALLGPCLWAPGVERLRAELAVSQALEAASSSHLTCLRVVGARSYALGAICAVLGTPRPRVVWSACVGAADDLSAFFEGNGGFDAGVDGGREGPQGARRDGRIH